MTVGATRDRRSARGPTGVLPPTARWLTPGRRRRMFGLALLAPAVLFAVGLVAYPMARTLWLSVHDGKLTRPLQADDFVGLQHYTGLLTEPDVWHSALVTLTYTLLVTGISYFVGLGLALLLNRPAKGIRGARVLITIPWAVPSVIAGYVFIWMVDANFGVVNGILERVGLIDEPVAWLIHGDTALISVIVVSIWKLVPFSILTNLAGLQAVPGDVVESAKVDGATRFQSFRHITWPALGHVRTVTIILSFLVTFREFGMINVMTGGGPDRATETLSVRLYVRAFEFFDFGEAAALGVLMLVISVALTAGMLRLMKQDFY